MKTVFISSFHPFISKNILNTDVFKILKQRKDLKIILLVPDVLKDFFGNNYGSDNVIIEGIDLAPFSKSRSNSFFSKSAFLFIYSHWIRRKRRDYLNEHPSFYNFLKFHILIFITRVLSGHKMLNEIFRFFDRYFSPIDFYKNYFEKYNPDIIFSTDVYNDFDQALVKEAKMRKIFVVGMVRSWDNNFSKGLMRFLSDKLVVNNEIIKKEVIELHNYPEKDIFIGGLPQFDDYLKAPFKSREEFFDSLGGDSNKKTILFAPGSPKDSDNSNIIIYQILKEAKEKNILPSNVQFLISNHPTRPDSASEKLKNDPDFIIEKLGVIKNNGKFLEFSPRDNMNLIDMVYYSDVLIWMASSICLDALVFDKPEIVVNFDGFENEPYWSSVRRFHDEDHMRAFFETGGVKIAKKPEDIVVFTKSYLENPQLDAKGRKKAREQQLWRIDGKSGEHIANFILSFLF
ncbi:MAG: CDP-glycerol glycerophosphotransferase family protein [Candidatus Azambacteria bacterium]|nr:CDP-glycerol glycerophosphotransferase family protein [Candidatus Azambacteria bacterium]